MDEFNVAVSILYVSGGEMTTSDVKSGSAGNNVGG